MNDESRVVNAYCKRCGHHAHLTLSGAYAEMMEKRNIYVCSNCIAAEALRGYK